MGLHSWLTNGVMIASLSCVLLLFSERLRSGRWQLPPYLNFVTTPFRALSSSFWALLGLGSYLSSTSSSQANGRTEKKKHETPPPPLPTAP